MCCLLIRLMDMIHGLVCFVYPKLLLQYFLQRCDVQAQAIVHASSTFILQKLQCRSRKYQNFGSSVNIIWKNIAAAKKYFSQWFQYCGSERTWSFPPFDVYAHYLRDDFAVGKIQDINIPLQCILNLID